MKNKIAIFFVLFLSCSFNAYTQPVKKAKIEEIVAYISAADHPVVVNFWATWCAPCVHELPYFQSNISRYADQQVELVLVSLDFANAFPKKVKEFIKKNDYKATFFWLDESNADHFCPPIDEKWSGGIPATLFLNKKNGFRSFFERQLTEPQLKLELEKLVK